MDKSLQVKKVVKFYENGSVYASVTVYVTSTGKTILVPSEGYRLYPMDIRGVNAVEHGWDPDLIQHPLIGAVRRRCYMVPVKEEIYNPIMDLEWAEAQAETRCRRCRIPAEGGGTKICRDRSCYGCPEAGKEHITSETVSLDAMMEHSYREPSVGDVTSAKAMSDVEKAEFMDFLEQYNPTYLEVYKKDQYGYKTAEIAESLNVSDRAIRYFKGRINDLKKQFEAE